MTKLENAIAQTLGTLRDARLSQTLTSDDPVVPSVYFSWDQEEGEVEAELTSEPGRLFHLEARVSGWPRWWTLNLALGDGIFAPGETLGVAVDLCGDQKEQQIELLIRSARGEDVDDTGLSDTLSLVPARRTAVVLHMIQSGEHLAGPEAHHTLILRLPPVQPRLELTLFDLRLFRVPASPAKTPARTLTSLRS